MIPPVNDEVAIATSINHLYEQADVYRTADRPCTTPVYDFINLYSLIIDEIPYLTYRIAKNHLTGVLGGAISVPDSDQKLSGLLYLSVTYRNVPPVGYILVDQRDPIVRKRFTVAHELGHYVLHFMRLGLDPGNTYLEGINYPSNADETEIPSGEMHYSRGEQLVTYPRDVIDRMEREANQFAAELLVPADLCTQMVTRIRPQFGVKRSILRRYLASEFLVSNQAILIRLSTLNLGEG